MVSSNLDSLVVGLSYGLKKVHIRPQANLLASLITFFGTVLAMSLGRSLLVFLPQRLAGGLGSVIIMAIGLWGLVNWWLGRGAGADEDPAPLSLQAAATLGFALAVNNIGLGVGASITGIPMVPACLGSFLCSLLFLALGNRFGRSKVSEAVGRYTEPAADLIMIALGIFQFLT